MQNVRDFHALEQPGLFVSGGRWCRCEAVGRTFNTSSCLSISAGSSPFKLPFALLLLHNTPAASSAQYTQNGSPEKTTNANSPCSLQPLHHLPELERLRLLGCFPDLMYSVVLHKRQTTALRLHKPPRYTHSGPLTSFFAITSACDSCLIVGFQVEGRFLFCPRFVDGSCLREGAMSANNSSNS